MASQTTVAPGSTPVHNVRTLTNSLRRPLRSLRALQLLALLCAVWVPAWGQGTLPRPQVPSATGKPVADFTLQDQNGRPFHLAAERGKRTLLVFYRGYW